jgi:hypothetical protein
VTTTRAHACYDTDARACYDLRYYGYSPVLRGERAAEAEGEEVYFAQDPGDDGECVCYCHEDDD